MTTQKSTCKTFDRAYLASKLRLGWSYGFICFIITLACMPIPAMMSVHSILDRYSRIPSLNVAEEIIESFSEGFVYLWIFAFSAFAVIGGIMATDYMINRKKAYLYHSMPQKRLTHYSHSLLSVCIWFLSAVAANILITLLVFAANGVASGEIIGAFIWAALRAFIYFALVLALMSLCATLAGQTLSQLALLVTVCFLPMCIYLAVVQTVYHSTDYSSFFEVSRFFAYITPFYRLLMEYEMPYSALEFFVTLAVSGAIFVASYFIYKRRKIESAGTPIVHEKFGETLKYLLLIPITFFSGLLFEALGGGDGWLFFGFLFGAFVGLIFINLFLYRNPSRMFASAKGFIIFVVCFLVFFILVGYNVFGHDRYVPNEKNVSKITVQADGDAYTFRDDETVAQIIEFAEEMIELDLEEKSIYRNGWAQIKITTKLGYTYQKRIPYVNFDASQQLYTILYSSEEYLDEHIKRARALLGDDDYKIWLNLPVIGDFDYSFSVDGRAFVEAYLRDVRDPMRAYSCYITTVYYRNCAMRVYSADENVMSFIAGTLGYEDGEEMLSTFREFARLCVKEVTVSISDTYLYDYYDMIAKKEGYLDGYWTNSDLYQKTYTGDEAYEIYLALAVWERNHSTFTYPALEPKYSVTVHYEMSQDLYKLFIEEYAPVYYEPYDEKGISYPSYNDSGIYTFSSYFNRDSVPSFVASDFSSMAQ